MESKRTILAIFITIALMAIIFALKNCGKDAPDPDGAPVANADFLEDWIHHCYF